jgi:hypothetical protein
MAADSGMLVAQRALAIICVDESDINRDYIKMYNLFKHARDRGYPNFNGFFETLIQPYYDIDYSKVLNMFIEVTKKGLDDFHYNIGSCYEHGVKWNEKYTIDINYASAAE